MDVSILRGAGLTDGESKVYVSLLKLGSVTTGPLIEDAKVSRSIIYQILDKLTEKGLVSYVIKEKTKYFQATHPKKILDYIKKKEEQFQEDKKKIEELLPELLTKRSVAKRSEVNLYLGLKGIRTAYENVYDTLTKGDEFHFLGISPELSESQDIYWEQDQKRRIKAGIKCQLLFNRETSDEIIRNRNKYAGCKAKIMDSSIKTPAMFMTYNITTVIILQKENPIAIEIINKDIADSFQKYFNEYWKRAK